MWEENIMVILVILVIFGCSNFLRFFSPSQVVTGEWDWGKIGWWPGYICRLFRQQSIFQVPTLLPYFTTLLTGHTER